ncbi:DgyrCDS9318 [Dimorphilus gyrociliatus]|uniref:DgyrCDS9318 n=1 Tax=Dimorphilus gyrociliatus TaxID=2664684 RepID=A0A7I8VWN5_9ANNE|nr:DgyrCDS9318 [Dimorphilus gyrociliatus]
MEKYHCPCWNVCLRVKKHSSKELPDDLPANDSFFSLQLVDVHLPAADVSWKYESLVEISAVQDWIIRRCANCNTYLYAEEIASDMSTFLMNANLKKNENEEEIEKSINYSPVYKIVIDSRNIKLPPSNVFQFDAESSITNKYIEENMELYQEYLKKEKIKMEERIRQYQEEEKNRFEVLVAKAHKDKCALNRLVLSLSKNENAASDTESIAKAAEKKSSPAVIKKRSKGPDDDFFDIEMEEEEGNQSLDDLDDETDYKTEVFNAERSGGDFDKRDRWNIKQEAVGESYSTAAINISSLSDNKRLERTRSCLDDDDDAIPVDIARSMKELSLSLHKNYDSYVFGERPKSKRANASEIASSMVANRKDSEDF